MVDITIVNGVYKPTNITGGHHPVTLMFESEKIGFRIQELWTGDKTNLSGEAVATMKKLQ